MITNLDSLLEGGPDEKASTNEGASAPSTGGTNYGNIRSGSNGFRTYDSDEAGAQDQLRLLGVYQTKKGLNTIGGIVDTWAPPSDNNKNNAAYKQHIADAVGVGINDPIDLSDPEVAGKFAHAQAEFEKGVSKVNHDENWFIDQASNRSGNEPTQHATSAHKTVGSVDDLIDDSHDSPDDLIHSEPATPENSTGVLAAPGSTTYPTTTQQPQAAPVPSTEQPDTSFIAGMKGANANLSHTTTLDPARAADTVIDHVIDPVRGLVRVPQDVVNTTGTIIHNTTGADYTPVDYVGNKVDAPHYETGVLTENLAPWLLAEPFKVGEAAAPIVEAASKIPVIGNVAAPVVKAAATSALPTAVNTYQTTGDVDPYEYGKNLALNSAIGGVMDTGAGSAQTSARRVQGLQDLSNDVAAAKRMKDVAERAQTKLAAKDHPTQEEIDHVRDIVGVHNDFVLDRGLARKTAKDEIDYTGKVHGEEGTDLIRHATDNMAQKANVLGEINEQGGRLGTEPFLNQSNQSERDLLNKYNITPTVPERFTSALPDKASEFFGLKEGNLGYKRQGAATDYAAELYPELYSKSRAAEGQAPTIKTTTEGVNEFTGQPFSSTKTVENPEVVAADANKHLTDVLDMLEDGKLNKANAKLDEFKTTFDTKRLKDASVDDKALYESWKQVKGLHEFMSKNGKTIAKNPMIKEMINWVGKAIALGATGFASGGFAVPAMVAAGKYGVGKGGTALAEGGLNDLQAALSGTFKPSITQQALKGLKVAPTVNKVVKPIVQSQVPSVSTERRKQKGNTGNAGNVPIPLY